jgi:site-specific DNA-methyltransferase (adenine-specific)
MAVNLEDAGFEIRDIVAWVYGSGFPKSLNIGKSIEAKELTGSSNKTAFKYLDGKKTETKLGYNKNNKQGDFRPNDYNGRETTVEHILHTESAKKWEGWGTALKPAMELWTLCRKPLAEPTVAENVLKYGTGGINIDGCRVGTDTRTYKGMSSNKPEVGTFRDDNWKPKNIEVTATGRFPANLIHDGSDEVVGLFPVCKQAKNVGEFKQLESMRFSAGGEGVKKKKQTNGEIKSASASRFFYCAKASKRERNMGCEDIKNSHPTIKPLALMEYLVKLVSREGQVVLDPFMGSGTTGMACKKLDREFIGIEMMPEYMEIAKARIEGTKKEEQLGLI